MTSIRSNVHPALTQEQIETIDNAQTEHDALSRAGEMGDSFHVHRSYIEAKRDRRSTSRLNDRVSVRARFTEVWRENRSTL